MTNTESSGYTPDFEEFLVAAQLRAIMFDRLKLALPCNCRLAVLFVKHVDIDGHGRLKLKSDSDSWQTGGGASLPLCADPAIATAIPIDHEP